MKKRTVLFAVLAIAMVMAAVLPAFGAERINLYSSGSDNVRIQ